MLGEAGQVVRVDHKRGVAVVSVGLGQWEAPLEEVFPLAEKRNHLRTT